MNCTCLSRRIKAVQSAPEGGVLDALERLPESHFVDCPKNVALIEQEVTKRTKEIDDSAKKVVKDYNVLQAQLKELHTERDTLRTLVNDLQAKLNNDLDQPYCENCKR